MSGVNPGPTLYPDGGNNPAGNPGAAIDPATGAQKFGSDPIDPSAQNLASDEPKKEEPAAAPAPAEPEAKPPEEPKTDEPPAEKKEAEAVTPTPIEAYKDLALPEAFAVDEASMTEFKTAASELGLPVEGAKRMMDLYAKITEKNFNDLTAAVQQQTKAQHDGWVKELTSMPDFQGEAAEQTRTFLGRLMDEFGSPELASYVNQTGLGDHPGLVKMILSMGKALVEGDPTPPGDPGSLAGPKPNGRAERKTPGGILYGNSTP